MEAVVGGYRGDIAISNATLSINDNCSFTPRAAQLNSFGNYLCSRFYYVYMFKQLSVT